MSEVLQPEPPKELKKNEQKLIEAALTLAVEFAPAPRQGWEVIKCAHEICKLVLPSEVRIDEMNVRTQLWYLIDEGRLELTSDRRVKLPS